MTRPGETDLDPVKPAHLTITPTNLEPLTSLSAFTQMLISSGEIVVGQYDKAQILDETDFREALQEMDQFQRSDLGLDLPALDFESTLWAVKQLYLACQFLVCREVGEADVRAAFAVEFALPRTAESEYSVDLVFRFIPDLHAIAHRIAPADALTEILTRLAQQWPLSSVGVTTTGGCDIGTFASHPALLRLYADRVSERSAKDRLSDPRLCALLRADAGMFPELIPFPITSYSHA